MKPLDPNICYAAVKSRDERFDGRFFSGVTTTGIYCRPICPAPTPFKKNVLYFRCAAAAAAAGFRPCLRCKPEASPGTPEWNGHSETVARALQLISDGFLKYGSIESLADQLGMSTRQLRRLFQQQLGATPKAVANTYRIQLAKKLLDETTLSMSEIAFCSGFSSIRRFNDAFSHAYSMAPSRFRDEDAVTEKGSTLTLKLTYRTPYDWESIIGFLSTRAIPGVEQVSQNGYQRTVQLDGEVGVIEVTPVFEKRHLLLTIPPQLAPHVAEIVERIRRLFDLKAEPNQIADLLQQDTLLKNVLKKHPGLRVPGAWDGFELAVRAVLGQQISVKAATTFAHRIVQTYGTPVEQLDEGGLTHLFPTPEQLSKASLSEIGLTKKRAETIQNMAKVIADQEIDFSMGWSLKQTILRWTELPGIGPWTAHYIAMRALREPDAFPADDLVLRQVCGTDKPLTAAQLRKRAEAWRPWRAYATIALWRHAVDQSR
jgi:AraC family transcriptional regulator of adaptative response / DNA-3-methyladenine glycosylase II